VAKRPEHYQDGGPSVEFYDLREKGGPGTLLEGDVEFYLAQARKTGGPVLDLACGTGRVALPLAHAGFDVTGIDRAPDMIAIARAKQRAAGLSNMRFARGNMATFTRTRRFGLVVIAYRAFQHLLTAKEQRACLERARRHLTRGGRLAVHLFDPRLEFCVPSAPPMNRNRSRVHDPASGRDVSVEVLERQVEPVTQTFSEIWRWTVSRGGEVLESTEDVLRLRWIYRYEMRYLLEVTGFRVLAEYSDFKRSAPRYGAEQIWVAERI
jgi:SAM-dependent methyltransferase